MKKNKLFAVLVSILMFATVFMSGCAFFKGANKLELTEMPKSTYTLTEGWTASQESLTAAGFSFAIKLTKGEEVKTYVFGKEKTGDEVQLTYDGGFKVDGVKIFDLVDFNLSKAGKFTAKIKGEGAICTFVYTVKDLSANDGFARGSGVEGDPYIIEDVQQFLKIDAIDNAGLFGETTVKYFKLNADIDLAGIKKEGFISFDGDNLNTVIKRVQNISLDGNGHKLYNFDQDLDCVFGDITTGTASFTGIDFELAGQNMAFFYITAKNTTVTFNKVNARGVKLSASGNTGVYTVYSRGVLYFNECKNYCNVSSDQTYVSGFAGYPLNDITFVNCTNYADIAAERAGAFICNGAWVDTATFVNCGNEGKLISVVDSNMCFAVSSAKDSLLTEKNVLESTFSNGNGKDGGKLSVDQATFNNLTNRDNMIIKGSKDVYSQYLETCAFNANHELEIKLAADKVSKVTRIMISANYLPSYKDAKGGHGTTRQYLTETWTTITGDVMKTTNVLGYGIKVLETLPEGTSAATNDNKSWSVVDGSFVIEVNQVAGAYTLIKSFDTKTNVETLLKAGNTYELTYTVFIYEGNLLVAGKSGKIADFKA